MKKDKQQNRNKRILIAILMLLITGIALTTATYAWFSANTAVSATGIDVKVTTSAGIAISADAKNFGKTTAMSDVIAFAEDATFDSTLQLPQEISPVTTIGAQTGMSKFNFFRGELGEDNEVLLTSSTEVHDLTAGYTSGDYIAFDLYFRSSSPQTIRLNDNSSISLIDGGDNLAYLQSGLRLGFINLGSTTDTNATTAQASAYNLNKATTDWKIWNPFPYVHHSSSLYEGHNDRDTGEATDGYYGGKATTAGAGSYNKEGVATVGGDYEKFLYKDVHGTAAETAFYELFNADNAHYLQGSASSLVPTGNVFTLGSGVTKIRVYIWLEGNDIDTVDSISISDGVTINLGFEIAA